MRIIPFMVFLTALLFSAEAQRYLPRLGQLDVRHYRFELNLSDDTDMIEGHALVQVRFLQSLPEYSLDLYGRDPDGKGMTVSSVTDGEREVSFRQEGERLFITLAPAAAAGEERTFGIRYRGIPADGLIIDANKYGQRTFFGDNWPDRAHHWLPTVDHPSDKATVEFIVTAPEQYQVVANGVQVEETNLDGGRKRTHWRETVPLPTKVMVIGVARFAVQLAGEAGGIPVSSWVYNVDREAGFYDYETAVGVLDWFIQQVGPYPYRKLANVQSKTRYGGMENAGNIFYFENSVTGKRTIEPLLAHEIAHQWFGNSASEKNWHHIWLSEGFATYLTNLYLEAKYGPEVLRERQAEERDEVIDYAGQRLAPIVDTTVTDYNKLLNPNSYQKGGWVLHMLRHQVGEEHFLNGLRQYYRQYAFGNALTDDFRRVMETTSGQDLEAFFRQWVFRAGHPVLNLEWDNEKKKRIRIRVLQAQAGEAFSFPLDIDVHYAETGRDPKKLTLQIKAKEEVFRIKTRGEVSHLQMDPQTWLLFAEE